MNKKVKSKLLNNVEDLSLKVTNDDEAMAIEFLRKSGVNVDEEKAFGTSEVQRLFFLAKARKNQERDNSLLKRLQDKITESYAKNALLTEELLRNSLLNRRASFQFRNIENWTESEMREVLSDLDLTKLLEDLDKID